MERKIVYICSKFSGDEQHNAEMARRYCRHAVDRGFVPLAPHLLLPQFLSEKRERTLAIQIDLRLLRNGVWCADAYETEGTV